MRHPTISTLQRSEVRPRPTPKHSQAHKGVAPLNPLTHRNTSFQPLPRPLGLAPYHYDLAENFPDVGDAIKDAKRMVFHVVGDTGGIQEKAKALRVRVLQDRASVGGFVAGLGMNGMQVVIAAVATEQGDSFSYSAKPVVLANPKSVADAVGGSTFADTGRETAWTRGAAKAKRRLGRRP